MNEKRVISAINNEAGNLSITTKQFKDGVRKQYGEGVEGLNNCEELRNKICELGVDPDELARQIQSDIDGLDGIPD